MNIPKRLLLEVLQPHWVTVFAIPKGTVVPKGRHGPYHELMKATATVEQRYGCYAWTTPVAIRYCGCITKDYKNVEFKSNLHGRVHNYFQNHHGQTNKYVFDRINEALHESDILLQWLSFDSLILNDRECDFSTFSNDRTMVRAVEELLILTHRRIGECDWNRT